MIPLLLRVERWLDSQLGENITDLRFIDDLNVPPHILMLNHGHNAALTYHHTTIHIHLSEGVCIIDIPKSAPFVDCIHNFPMDTTRPDERLIYRPSNSDDALGFLTACISNWSNI